MSETNESEREIKTTDESAANGDPAVKKVRVEEAHSRPVRRANRTAVVAIVGMVAVAGLALLLWLLRPGGDGAGRPVPAPRSITLDQPANEGAATTASTEPTVTLAPGQVERAGIKVEAVGEAMSGEAAGQQATGVVQPNAYRETPVMSLVGGVVRRVNAELGQGVGRGQPLAVITSSDLADAQSRYVAAVAELDEHHKHHARTAKLVEIGAASREEFEMATSKLRTAESDVENLRQRLLLLGLTPQRVSQLRSPSQISSEVTLPAPVAGTVTSRMVNPGEVIEANKELLRVTDLSSVWVVGQVYEKDLGRIRVGSGASITSDAYPGRVFRGQIAYVDPRLDPQTRTAQVRIELANTAQALKLGMYVNVAFATVGGSERTAPVVPVTAVQNMNNQQVVFMATGDPNTFVMRSVRLGPESSGLYPVLEGLNVGDRIVTDGSFSLRAEWLKTHPSGPQ
jgi:cobalt-zinc-cadmium efflux system membrane fusion protein